MTKGQKAAVNYIEDFILNADNNFSWKELVDAVRESKAVVRNWMSIRGVVQWFVDEGLIERTSDIRVEAYKKTNQVDPDEYRGNDYGDDE